MGNNVTVESEPRYLVQLKRRQSFGSLSQRSSDGNVSDDVRSNLSGRDSVASSVPTTAFDAYNHNIKTVAIELRDGFLQYRYPNVSQCLASTGDFARCRAELSTLALIVVRVSRKPADNKDLVVSAADTASLYTWSEMAQEVFTPRGLAEPRSADLGAAQWRCGSGRYGETSMALYLLRGHRAHPRAVFEAMFTLNHIASTFLHEPQAISDLFYNRHSGAHPQPLQYIEGSRDVPNAAMAVQLRSNNHILRTLLGKTRAIHTLSSSAALQQDGTGSIGSARGYYYHQQNGGGLGMTMYLGGASGQQQQQQQHVRENVSRMSDLKPLALNTLPTHHQNSNGNAATGGLPSRSTSTSPKPNMHSTPTAAALTNNSFGALGRVASVERNGDNNNNNNDRTTPPIDPNLGATGNYDEIVRQRTGGDFSRMYNNSNNNTNNTTAAAATVSTTSGSKSENNQHPAPTGSASSAGAAAVTATTKPAAFMKGAAANMMMAIDLKSSENRRPIHDAYPEDDRERRLREAAPEATEVLEGMLYVGGEMPSRNRELLKRKGITHIINCAASMLECKFPADFEYIPLELSDSADEQIQFLFPYIIGIIDRVLSKERGRVLVHCHQGVSRSCTLVIAFIMWRFGLPYNAAFKKVREKRMVCSPNAGFMCNLMRWENTLTNAHRYVFVEYGPYRHDMQWPFVWRLRLPEESFSSLSAKEEEASSHQLSAGSDGRSADEDGTGGGGGGGKVTRVDVHPRSVTALVKFEDRATTCELFVGPTCEAELVDDALQSITSWVNFGNFSLASHVTTTSSSGGRSQYHPVEALQPSDLAVNNLAPAAVMHRVFRAPHQPEVRLEIRVAETPEYSALVNEAPSYHEAKQLHFEQEMERAKKRGLNQIHHSPLASSTSSSGGCGAGGGGGVPAISSIGRAQQQNQQLLQLHPASGSGSTASLTAAGSGSAHIGGLGSSTASLPGAGASTSTAALPPSPNASEEVRSSVPAALSPGQFVAYRATDWQVVDYLFDYEDFDTEEVYLLFMQPSSSSVKHGKIYLWIGGDSGWGEHESLESYHRMVRENLQPAATEILKSSAFSHGKVTVVHDAQEPDEFVSLF